MQLKIASYLTHYEVRSRQYIKSSVIRKKICVWFPIASPNHKMLFSFICLLSLLVVGTAFHGYHLKQANRGISFTTSSAFVSRTNISSRKTHLYAEEGIEISGTVVSRCTQKITDSLQPTECIVTSTDSDPNGSHVRISVRHVMIIMTV